MSKLRVETFLNKANSEAWLEFSTWKTTLLPLQNALALA